MLDNDDNPNTDGTGTTEGTEATGEAVQAPTAPVKRIRVAALAKELGITSRSLIARLADLGMGPKTASSALDQAQADQLRAAAEADAAVPAADTPTEQAVEAVAGVEAVATDPTGPDSPENTAGPAGPIAPAVLFQAPEAVAPAPRRRRARKPAADTTPADTTPADTTPADTTPAEPAPEGPDVTVAEDAEDRTAEPEDIREAAEEAVGAARRRRRRGRRGRGGGHRAAEASDDAADSDDSQDDAADRTADATADTADTADTAESGDTGDTGESDDGQGEGGGRSTRRRRRRRRSGSGSGGDSDGSGQDDPPNTVTHVREAREGGGKADDDGVKGVKGSTRLEARRQRRRDGRETSRRRPPILSEAEFLARREAVDRVMAVRQEGDRTQIAVLEDNVLVEHYVTRASATSYVGNIYLGRVQNVLPSMEAAFVDIGKGRNGVLYAGEVNWDAAGLEGKSRAIEQALKSGDAVLVQVTKDPIGHKGARLTSQVSLPGRFLVYVPGGGMTGISRRLPDTERHRLKSILKKIVPEDAGVIVRTAAEGASEEDLTRDVERLQAQWENIQKKAAKTSAAPTLVHGEPDLAIRVVRDVFNEDFKKLVVQGGEAWNTVSEYVASVAPDLADRVSKHTGDGDLFHELRVDEQIMKALDRKVWLPSGGSLVIDRTEAMTVIDVNTGKFVGSGGNLEQTVTRNNLEAAEEIVRQLRLRDVGGIVVIDFIDMVLESNRELVLRRLTECLARDRTKHQVAEVTSLGLVQMTRKRVGEGLLEAFSETCEVCHGRGIIVHPEPVDKSSSGQGGASDQDDGSGRKSARRRRAKRAEADTAEPTAPVSDEQRTKALAAMTAIHRAAKPDSPEAAEEAAAELELDAVTAVLSGSEVDVAHLAAEAADELDTVDVEEVDVDELDTGDVDEIAVDHAEPQPGTDGAQPAAPPVAQPAPQAPVPSRPRRRRAASRPAGPPQTG